MLKRYVSSIRRRLPAFGQARRAALWADRSFGDFVVDEGDRRKMLATIADHAVRLTTLAHDLDADAESKSQLAKTLLNVCAWVDSGHVRLEGSKLRSYEDISIQVATLHRLVDYLSAEVATLGGSSRLAALLVEQCPDSRPALLVQAEMLMGEWGVGSGGWEKGAQSNAQSDASSNASSSISHTPHPTPHSPHASSPISHSPRPTPHSPHAPLPTPHPLDTAIALIQRALRIQAVCPTAQQLLARAYRARRQRDGDGGELDGMNYDLSDKFCHMPFTELGTGFKGDAFVCCCPAWVPYPVGNVFNAPSAEAVWNSEAAVEIRRSIHDGDFKYCSRTLCSYIAAQKLPRKDDITDPTLRGYIEQRKTVLHDVPQMFQLNHDPTCNLACPSCRTEIIASKAEEQDMYAQAAERVILPLLGRINGQSYISGGGEAFASKHFRSILAALNRTDYPGLNIHLITNGLLITRQRWSEFPNLPEMLDVISVSIDAARPDTYERLRRPGKWPALMNNLELLAAMRRSGTIRRLQINFVVQEDNYREILEFVALGKRLGVDAIWFQRLTNYGAFDEGTFVQADVTSTRHPEHEALLEILRNPLLKQPGIDMEMLMPLLPEVVASDLRLPLLYDPSRRAVEEYLGR